MKPASRIALRRAAALVAAGLAVLPALPAAAQETFPARAITMVIGTPPGGFADIVARLVGPVISDRVGQPVLVDNRPGAGTAIGVTAVARARPDGHTVGIALNSAITMLPFMQELQYDPVKDLAAVGLIGNIYTVWVVAPNSRFKTVADVVAAASTLVAKAGR